MHQLPDFVGTPPTAAGDALSSLGAIPILWFIYPAHSQQYLFSEQYQSLHVCCHSLIFILLVSMDFFFFHVWFFSEQYSCQSVSLLAQSGSVCGVGQSRLFNTCCIMQISFSCRFLCYADCYTDKASFLCYSTDTDFIELDTQPFDASMRVLLVILV